MRKLAILLIGFVSFYAHADYFLCIDAGGSKTALQVMNQEGEILPLTKKGVTTKSLVTSGANINLVGPEGVKEVLDSLIEEVLLLGNVDLKSLLPTSHVIAGMAGATLAHNKQAITSLIQEKGASLDHITVMSDAEMALELLNDEGIILIAGTGSVCFAKKGDKRFRVGGLGRILGDEGSGYHMGLQALKAAIAHEYGWGAPTNLTPILKMLFQASDLKMLIPQITLGEIPPAKIASSTPFIFTQAWEGDTLAQEIIDQAAAHLSDLLTSMLSISSLDECEIHLWGGVFKNKHSEAFIQNIKEQLPKPYQKLNIINQAHNNPATLFAIKKIIKRKDELD